MKRIGIVGAGISGLCTAWHLSRLVPDAKIDVLERDEKLGGVIQTIHEPYLIECGADNFATLLPDAIHWVREMGLESDFISPQTEHRIAQVVRHGRLVPIPNGFSLMQPTRLAAMMTTPILSIRGKCRVLLEYFIPRRRSTEDESVADFAIRRLGRECFERLVEPIVGGIFTARAETLSMQAAMPQFVAMEREHGSLIRAAIAKRRESSAANRAARTASGARYDQFIAPRMGMSWWIEQIAAPIRSMIRVGTEARSIRRSSAGIWECEISSKNAGNRINAYDQICLAVPSYVAARLLREVSADLSSSLASIPYASSAVAVLGVRREEIRPDAICFGAISPSIENRNCLAISLSSEKYAGRCPDELVLARVFLGGAVRPDLFEESDATLLELAKGELKSLFGPTSPPVYESLVRWPRAMPQYLVGHCSLVERIQEGTRRLPGLELVGNAYAGVGIPQCIRSAKSAAHSIAHRCGA